GYFDVGFQSEEDAEVAAQTPLIYKKNPIPTTCTHLPSDTMLVVSFINLPSHLPPQVLYDQLVVGLMAYGTQPNLIFAIPSGAEYLAAPRATATIIPHHPTIAQQIPPCASVAAAPDHFFWAQVNNGRQICSLCFGLNHAKRVCPQAKSAAVASEPPSGANQSNAWTTIGTQAATHLPNPTHPNLNATISVNQNPWDLLAETDKSGNVLISKHTGQPLCQGDYDWAEFFLPDFDETPTPHHFTPLPNTAPFQSDHQLTLAAVASPHYLKLCTAVAQSVAQLQHGLPTLFFPPTSLNLPAVISQNYSMMLNISLFTQLPEACKEAEVLLTAFVETLSHHYLDAEEENSYYTDLNPHYVDAPTPWLSALIWYCNQHPLIEVGLSENQPPNPSSPSAMVVPNTAPFQSDHQLTLAAVASPQCPKLCTAVAQSVAQLQHGLPTLFFPLTSLNLPAVTS
ncbi:hypothetical protein L0F63_006694, partial [Massospora cicadina]